MSQPVKTTIIPNDRLILVFKCATCGEKTEVTGSELVRDWYRHYCRNINFEGRGIQCPGIPHFVQAKLVLADGDGPVVKLKPLKGKTRSAKSESGFNSLDLMNAMLGGNRIPERGKL